MVPLRAGEDGHEEASWREASCGTVSFHDGDGERLHTIYLGRMPESGKVSLKAQFRAEGAHIQASRPDIGIVAIADGALDNWNFADEHFPDAIQIVDIFHAKGHLFEVAKAIYGIGSEIGDRWARKRREELDEGRVDEVIAALRSHAETCEETRKNAEYFSNNRERMNYPKFRAMGLCVASGVVEEGLQEHRRRPSQAGWNALDRRRRQRHHRTTLRRREQSLITTDVPVMNGIASWT